MKGNRQCRIPKRWIAFDTESKSSRIRGGEVQTWSVGAAVRWRRDLKTGQATQRETFNAPEDFWCWVDGFCVRGTRTVCVALNLGHDVRISQCLTILPRLGWRLDFHNLDRNVSTMVWRSDHGTLVLSDLATWLPIGIKEVGTLVGLGKRDLAASGGSRAGLRRHCLRDAEIVARAVEEIVSYIEKEELGNWQPTGAGMAYATWRHRFMTHKVLVHDDVEALSAERAAMHTGRAEAWRHGVLAYDTWHEIDMRNAYTRIASECDLPTKLKFKTGAISVRQYEQLTKFYRVLVVCRVTTDVPCVPYFNGERILWPVGTFETVLWDVEADLALGEGAKLSISKAICYTRHPVLADWGKWILGVIHAKDDVASPVVKAWAKHCGRALIGRLSLRSPVWEEYGENPEEITGITYMVDVDTGKSQRMMHVGNQTFIESDRVEGHDSLPQITGWVMAECRVRLYEAIRAAGYDNVGHVDTDSVLVNSAGLANLRRCFMGQFELMWHCKASFGSVVVYGPRNLRAGRARKVAGVPLKATEVLEGVFKGEKWSGTAADIQAGRSGAVTVHEAKWTVTAKDPRRLDAGGGGGRTRPIRV